MQIILASQSPRRQQLLTQMGLAFTVEAADIDETMDMTRPVGEQVALVSARKASAIAAQSSPEDVVIAADTVVVCSGSVLGKPRDSRHAAQMLRSLSGRTHQVMTGVTVQQGEKAVSHTEVTSITFRELTDTEIDTYIASGDPMDKAGSYGIQNAAAVFCRKMEGDYFNVMGLPLCALTEMLRSFGIAVLGEKG